MARMVARWRRQLKEAARWQSDSDMAAKALGAYRITQAGVSRDRTWPLRVALAAPAKRAQAVHLADEALLLELDLALCVMGCHTP